MTYSNITWQTSTAVNVQISGGNVTGTGTTASYTSNVRSEYAITSNDGVEINTLVSSGDNQSVTGLGVDPYTDTQTYQAVEYGMMFANSTWYIYESGTLQASYANSNISDEAKIVRDGSTIRYYINNVLKRTVTGTTTADMYAQSTLRGVGSVNVKTNASQSSGGSGGSGSSTPIEGGQYIDHILYMQTVVPR